MEGSCVKQCAPNAQMTSSYQQVPFISWNLLPTAYTTFFSMALICINGIGAICLRNIIGTAICLLKDQVDMLFILGYSGNHKINS